MPANRPTDRRSPRPRRWRRSLSTCLGDVARRSRGRAPGAARLGARQPAELSADPRRPLLHLRLASRQGAAGGRRRLAHRRRHRFGTGEHATTRAACSLLPCSASGGAFAIRSTWGRAPASWRWRRRGAGRATCSPATSTPVGACRARERQAERPCRAHPLAARQRLSPSGDTQRRPVRSRHREHPGAAARRDGRRPCASLAPDGVAILSACDAQAPLVLAPTAPGLGLRQRITVEGWETLLLARRPTLTLPRLRGREWEGGARRGGESARREAAPSRSPRLTPISASWRSSSAISSRWVTRL